MGNLILITRTATHIVRQEDILCMKAMGSYTIVILTNGSEIKVSRNMSHLFLQLKPPHLLVKTHRSCVVNKGFIEKFNRLSTTREVVHLRGGYIFPLSRYHRKDVIIALNEN